MAIEKYGVITPHLASVSGDGEFHSNLGLRFDRLSRRVIRLKAPLLYGFTRGSKKNLWTTDYPEVLDVPIFVDSGQQHHRPFHRLLFRQQRIHGSYRRRCEFDDPGRKANLFSRFDLACPIPRVRIDHVRSRKSFAAQIEVNGVISRADYLMPAATRYHFHRE